MSRFGCLKHGTPLALLACLIVTAPGCTVWRSKLPGARKWADKDELPDPKQPDKLVALWSDTAFYQAGGVPTRGLGGRIYFYDGQQNPTNVDGQLVVYAFEDKEGEDPAANKPVKKFVFTPEQLGKHYSASEFGPSYSFWLPWDSAMGEVKAVSVVPIFTDATGKIVMGQHARHRLPGKQSDEERLPSAAGLASGKSQLGDGAPDDGLSRREPTTISLRGPKPVVDSTLYADRTAPSFHVNQPIMRQGTVQQPAVQRASYESPAKSADATRLDEPQADEAPVNTARTFGFPSRSDRTFSVQLPPSTQRQLSRPRIGPARFSQRSSDGSNGQMVNGSATFGNLPAGNVSGSQGGKVPVANAAVDHADVVGSTAASSNNGIPRVRRFPE